MLKNIYKNPYIKEMVIDESDQWSESVRKTIISIAVILALPVSAYAGNANVSLREAISLALERHHLIKAAGFERTAAASEESVKRSRYLPRILMEEGVAASNAPTRVFMMKLDQSRFTANDFEISNLNHPKASNDFSTKLTLEQPLLDLSIGQGVEMVKNEEKKRDLLLEGRRQEVASKVYSAYLEIRRARAYLKATEQALIDAKEHQRLAVVRSEAGMGLKSDELRARTFLSEIEQQNITANNNLLLAKIKLARATAGNAGELLDISDGVDVLHPSMGIDDLKKLALRNRIDIKTMEKDVDKAALGVKMARSAYLPTIYADASYQLNDRDVPFGNDNDSWFVGATLRWELFDGMRRRNEVKKNVALEKAAAEYVNDYRQDVDLQVTESFLRYQEAQKRLEVARNSSADADESVRLLEKRFQNSLATMSELLDAQTALNRARANVIDMENQLALSAADIYLAAGTFLQEVMK